MATDKAQPWYVAKRAEAFVYSLFAERNVAVRDREDQDFGVDFVVDLRKNKRELGRFLAVQLFAYADLPNEADLKKEIVKRFPAQLREEFMLPLTAFAVQVKELTAVYTWILEPFVKRGDATLHSPVEYCWRNLDDQAINEILDRVAAFWDALVKKVKT